jgi:hypothetical protein
VSGGSLRGWINGLRLWAKLAAFAVLGVVAMHAVHLAVGTRVATRALARDQAQLGGGVARLVAGEAADPILLHDGVTLSEIVGRAAGIPGIAYCFIVRDGAVLASSFRGGTPAALLDVRGGGKTGPLVVVDASGRFLDLEEPILGGEAGQIRLGIDMALLQSTRREIAFPLGLVALAVILAGIIAAVVVGRSVVGEGGGADRRARRGRGSLRPDERRDAGPSARRSGGRDPRRAVQPHDEPAPLGVRGAGQSEAEGDDDRAPRRLGLARRRGRP